MTVVALSVSTTVGAATADPSAAPATDAGTEDFWSKALAWFLGVPVQILIIIAVTVVVIGLGHALINRTVGRLVRSAEQRELVDNVEAPRSPADIAVSRKRRAQRANAMGSLLRSCVTLIASGIAVLTILPLLGIDIAPLLASAGVLGVALGFGAQNLIKDYLSGIFLVLEDQYGVGDTVDVGGVIGVVEDVTLRVTQLRDTTGVVWYIRNGEILKVGNRSQGWTLAVADLPVAADTDLDLVRATVDSMAVAMFADPALSTSLLEPPKYAGVESVSGEAVFVRVVARAAPEEQVAMSRALRERLKDAFDSAGIRIPVLARMPGQQGLGTAPPGSGASSAGKAPGGA